MYQTKRAEVLRSLKQKSIFKTQLFQEKYEEQAKSNMEKEIQQLEQGLIV
jgi:predicted metal-dependent HD superfamily phosphohydrolase